MKYIDPDIFNRILTELEDEIRPKKESLLKSDYWSAVQISLLIVRKAAELATKEK